MTGRGHMVNLVPSELGMTASGSARLSDFRTEFQPSSLVGRSERGRCHDLIDLAGFYIVDEAGDN